MPGGQIHDRPFYFVVVLWGPRFRDYFVNLCLPSLLSPGNIPALSTRERGQFLICTRHEDFAFIKSTPAFQLLERHVDPVFVEIPPCPPGTEACVHMGIGHRRGCELAYARKAYPFVLQPDSVFSDGTIARLQELAREGVELALVPALRFAEEPLFEQFERNGIAPHQRRDRPLALASRDLVRMALASMHSETKTYEWDAPYFHSTPYAAWWRVPEEDGIVVHSMSWAPLLLDFTAVPEHDTSTFDNWTIDGDYVHKNLGNIKRVHLVLDSDEIFIASWAPLADKPYDLRPHIPAGWRGNLKRKAMFNRWYYSGVFDPLKQQAFFRAARWHAKPIVDPRWQIVQRRALRTLYSCVAPPVKGPDLARLEHRRDDSRLNRLMMSPWRTVNQMWNGAGVHVLRTVQANSMRMVGWTTNKLAALAHIAQSLWLNRSSVYRRLGQIMRGDRAAIARVMWRIRGVGSRLLGRTFQESDPHQPGK